MLKSVSFAAAALVATGLMVFAQDSASSTNPASDVAKNEQKNAEPAVVTRLRAYGKKEPGKVWRDEVTDERLFRLFDLADTKKEGVVTKDQLIVAAAKMEAEQPQRGRQGPERRQGGGGGRGGFGVRPQLGIVMPPFVQDELKLSNAQKQQIADLQKQFESKLDDILTPEQKKQYKEMKESASRGGPGGRGGFGSGPGGPPR